MAGFTARLSWWGAGPAHVRVGEATMWGWLQDDRRALWVISLCMLLVW